MDLEPTIEVVGAPGYEDFQGRLIPGLGEFGGVDDRGPFLALVDMEGDLFVIPSRYVREIA